MHKHSITTPLNLQVHSSPVCPHTDTTEDRCFKQISILTWAQFTIQVTTASPKQPFSCCEQTALLLILKQLLCWWFGNEQTEHWLCLPSLEVDSSKQAKNWASSQSCGTYARSTHQGTTCSSAAGASAALQGLPQLAAARTSWPTRLPIAGNDTVPQGPAGYTAEALT